VRRAALEHLPFIDEARALPVLRRAIAEDTPRARAAAATALGRVEGPEARATLHEALADPDAWVRYFAARALAEHGHEDALDALSALAAEDPAPHVRIAALESIGAIDGPRATSMLQPYAGTAERDIAVAALVALGHVSDEAALPTLQHALRSDDPARRLAAVRALGHRGGAASVGLLRWTAGGDASEEVSRAALDGLVTLAAQPGGWADAIDAVVELTADPKRREAAVAALARMPGARCDRVALGLAHASPEVRRATIDTLTRMKHPDASSRVREALDAPDATVREAAVAALDRVGATGLTRKLAAMAAGDPDTGVRRAAGAALARQPDKEDDGGARA
jgi:HEAT repeat protein